MPPTTLWKYVVPFLLNGAWFFGTYLLLQIGKQDGDGLASFYHGYFVIGVALFLGLLLNLTLCIVNYSRNRPVVGLIYAGLIAAFFLLMKGFATIHFPGKIGG